MNPGEHVREGDAVSERHTSNLSAADVEQIAAAVVERLRMEGALSVPPLVDADAVAKSLSISRAAVYRHADLLGARKIGGGRRPRLRFDLAEARAAWTARYANERSLPSGSPVTAGRVTSGGPPGLGTPTSLLPVGRAERERRRRDAAV